MDMARNGNLATCGNFGLRVLLALAFGAAGLAKLAGVEMMVGTFEAIGVGQWFRYLTGAIELGSAVLLWLPGLQFLGAALLVCTMIGAAVAHFAVLGPSAVPAMVLGLMAGMTLYLYRDQIPAR